MKCGKCGAENRDTNAFCDSCGAYLEDTVTGEDTVEKKEEIKNKSSKKTKKKLPVIFGKKNKKKNQTAQQLIQETADEKKPIRKSLLPVWCLL